MHIEDRIFMNNHFYRNYSSKKSCLVLSVSKRMIFCELYHSSNKQTFEGTE